MMLKAKIQFWKSAKLPTF